MPRESRGILRMQFHYMPFDKMLQTISHPASFLSLFPNALNKAQSQMGESNGCKKNNIAQRTLKSSSTKELQCLGASSVLITCCTLFNCQTCIYLWRCDLKLTSQVWTETNNRVYYTLMGLTTVSLHAICLQGI